MVVYYLVRLLLVLAIKPITERPLWEESWYVSMPTTITFLICTREKKCESIPIASQHTLDTLMHPLVFSQFKATNSKITASEWYSEEKLFTFLNQHGSSGSPTKFVLPKQLKIDALYCLHYNMLLFAKLLYGITM